MKSLAGAYNNRAVPTPEYEREPRQVAVATWAELIWLHAPGLSVKERLMEEAAMEKMIILVAILSIIVVASKFGRTISAARP
jgi:hypothetical protein